MRYEMLTATTTSRPISMEFSRTRLRIVKDGSSASVIRSSALGRAEDWPRDDEVQ